MSDRDKQLNKGELIDLKSLIGNADGGDFTLDDIMAEYGHPLPAPEEPEEEAPSEPPEEDPPRIPDNVVAFPGRKTVVIEPEEDEEVPPPKPPPPRPSTPRKIVRPSPPQEEPPSNVTPLPKKKGKLATLVQDLNRKADDYADHMFEEEESLDRAELRRLERLIPGTDQEETGGNAPARQWRRPRREEPLPPDVPPHELARRYGKGLKWMHTRAMLVLVLAALSLVQSLAPAVGFAFPEPLDLPNLQCLISAGLLCLGVLLSMDLLVTGVAQACVLKFGMDTLAALACAFTLADGVQLALAEEEAQRLPYTLVCLTGLFFLLHGFWHKRHAQRLVCRTAASTASPYRITLDLGKWNDQDTYAKWSGTQDGFGSQIQADDGAQRIFCRFCPLLAVADVVFALMASTGDGHPERLVWALSAMFTATAAFGGTLAYGRAFHKVTSRLSVSGAALAGWPGMAASRKGCCVLITDGDLFPPGYVELNGFKVMSDFPAERVVAYTATLIRDSGSGLTTLFHNQLRSMGGLMRHAEGIQYHEGGGMSANIRGDQVLVGSAAFMKLMEVRLPQGLNVKSAVFCAIDGRLAGIFALSYALPDTVFPALESLMMEKVEPVLATRDFNLIPAMLHQRFRLAADKMAFPNVERRRQLSDPDQEHDGVLTALLCREGLLPFSEAITAAKRLRWASRLGGVLCCAGSALGMALAAYLTSVGAYTSLSPVNLLIYMLTWFAPVWFLSGWVHRF